MYVRFTIGLLFATCTLTAVAEDQHNSLTAEEKAAGWQLLFDGEWPEQWRNFKKDHISEGWTVEEGTLVRKERRAGDLITKDQFGAFEMVLDYNISKGGNSGLMYHVTEEARTPWQTGPEIQIQDNIDGHDPQKAGWMYALYPAEVDTTNPPGEWNTIRILITPEKCVHWMNGTKYCEYVKGSDDWNARVAKTKFKKYPKFGVPTRGHICLQDHGNLVSFRNIKIRPID